MHSNAFSSRITYSINESWKFSTGEYNDANMKDFDDSEWEIINIPHTWNAEDAVSDPSGYYRGEAWYRRSIYIGDEGTGKQVYIFFEGVNEVADLYVNGVYVGNHKGGYTKFSFDITDYLKTESLNQFAIKVDNSFNQNIPPLTADFTFFGGVYRDVYLNFTEKVHISLTDYASSGVYITTPNVSAERAVVDFKTLVENKSENHQKVRIEHSIFSPNGNQVKKHSNIVNIKANTRYEDYQSSLVLENPLLWDTESPDLYRVYTRIIDEESGIVLDDVHNPLGIRWFEFTPSEGLILNGKHVKLVGTSRHQCFERMGNALRDEFHVKDVMLLKKMGGNFLRVAHYPQDPVVMELCDRLGIITSIEIPAVNKITENEEFFHNSVEMVKEMIRQDFNRPSVLIWNYMNEIMLRPPFEKETEQYMEYCANVAKYGRLLENTIRKEDPYRYTMLVFHGSLSSYEAAELVELPMLVGWNLYHGWYGSKLNGFDRFLDKFHDKYPEIPVFVSEYGAGVDQRIHSFEPERFDFSVEYGNIYHEHYLKTIMDRSFVVGSNIWNLNDFHSEERIDAVPHINSKGITTVSRELKDPYLLYQAALLDEPIVSIAGKGWKNRAGIVDSSGVTIQPLKIYSNANEVEVTLNSQKIGVFPVKDYVVNLDIPFVNGQNVIEAAIVQEEKVFRDIHFVDFKQVPDVFDDKNYFFSDMSITLGSNRYFEDKKAGVTFIPEKPYTEGSWGYIGGEPNHPKTRFGSLPASEKNIIGFDIDPVFQTQRKGINEFRFDIPDGRYAVYLYWAELDSDHEPEALAYNLGQDVINQGYEQRVFNVDINGKRLLNSFDMAEQTGIERGIIKKFMINAKDKEGIRIQFDPVRGETVLNAIRLYRIY